MKAGVNSLTQEYIINHKALYFNHSGTLMFRALFIHFVPMVLVIPRAINITKTVVALFIINIVMAS